MCNIQKVSESFLAFRSECIWLRTCYNTYISLYESGDEVLDILEGSAVSFFSDLNRILIEYIWLTITKLMDPAVSMGRENLSIDNINSLVRECGLLSKEIQQISDDLHLYRKLLTEARNRLISHLDKETVLADDPVGAHAQEKIGEFMLNLQAYLDAVGNALGIGPLDISGSVVAGDSIDLIKKLIQ